MKIEAAFKRMLGAGALAVLGAGLEAGLEAAPAPKPETPAPAPR